VKVVCITGFGRCGSTLMDRMLGELPEFTSLGEVRDLFDERGFTAHWCACGESVTECDLWAPVIADTLATLAIDERQALRLRAQESRQRDIPRLWRQLRHRHQTETSLNPYGILLRTIYECVLRQCETDAVIDSSKFVSDVLVLARDPSIDLHVVHLVRDPRGAAYSWSQTKADPGRQGESLQTFPPLKSSFFWLAANAEAELAVRPMLGSRYQRIRYEDFIEAPEEVMGDIVTSVGGRREDLPFVGPRAVNFATVTHMIGGNPNRFESGETSLLLDERWRHEMPRADLRGATVPALPLLHRYGYPLWPRRT
jgi:hypothetical protein